MTTSATETTSMAATTSSSLGVPTVRVGVRKFVRLEDCRELLDALRLHEHMCVILADWLEMHTHMDAQKWIQAAAQAAKGETCSTR